MNDSNTSNAPGGDASGIPTPNGLPEVPGGWTCQKVDLGWRTIELVQPALPDRFLDEPDVLEANRRDDYMPYWTYLWPASVPMARVLHTVSWPAGTEILELGSGIGLVGLAAAARGWNVTFSDYDETSLALCRVNAARNALGDVETLLLDWRRPAARQFPVILGCEVIYEARSHEPLLALLQSMLAPEGVCWIGDPGRSQAPRFCRLADDHGFEISVRDETGNRCEFPSGTELQILELRRGS